MIGDRKSRNATTLFLVSLSAADLLLVLVCAPVWKRNLIIYCTGYATRVPPICVYTSRFLDNDASFHYFWLSTLQLEALQYFVIQWDEAGTICKTAKYAEVLSAVASVLNLTAVSLERQVLFYIYCETRLSALFIGAAISKQTLMHAHINFSKNC